MKDLTAKELISHIRESTLNNPMWNYLSVTDDMILDSLSDENYLDKLSREVSFSEEVAEEAYAILYQRHLDNLPKTYGLIDKHSGYFWGYAKTKEPIDAINEIDRSNHESNDYEEVAKDNYRATFFVHDCSELGGNLEGVDGQDEEVIKIVEGCPLVGVYARIEPPELSAVLEPDAFF